MCGIVGILNLNQVDLIDPAGLRAMLGAIRHRGPDQFGIYVFQDEWSGIGLGNARLSIIDLQGGQQPISNEDGTIWIVFNGEIFNYVELRAELVRQGHRFATDSDTEVIVHLYEQAGPACVNYLNGQFAFALWDEVARTLLMARDRLGIRPLMYTVQNGQLIFASEIKALLTNPHVHAELDPITVDQIFSFWSPLPPHTSFKGILTLPPGHWLLVQPRPGREVQVERYWQLNFPARDEPYTDTTENATVQLRDLLVDATRMRLRADVAVGAYLSGGLDSSTIAALVHRYTTNRLETFSIAFSDEEYDESPFQKRMADHLGTRHHLITCTRTDIGQVFPSVIWHTETPLMRTSPAPLYLLSQLVRQHGFKVVLTGEGADELLAGYNLFKEAKIRRFWAQQPQSTWRPALLRKLYPYIGDLSKTNDTYLRSFFGQGLSDVDVPFYSHMIRWRNTSRCKRFFSQDLQAVLPGRDQFPFDPTSLPATFPRWSALAQAQYLESTIFLTEYLLSSQGDRVAMAHAVEGRFPFLDHRVVDFCSKLPSHLKLRGLNEKYLLKQVARDLLPECIWQRPKQPYRAPIHHSFYPDGRPLPWVAHLLSPSKLKAVGYFSPEAVAALQKKILYLDRLGETDEMALTGILSTQLVHEQYIASFHPPSPLSERDDLKMIRHGSALSPGEIRQSRQILCEIT